MGIVLSEMNQGLDYSSLGLNASSLWQLFCGPMEFYRYKGSWWENMIVDRELFLVTF
jgi:hypothetical protein